MINLLLIDTETTGVSADDLAIELAVTLYHVGATSGPVASLSTLLSVESNPAQSVNGIDPALTQIDAAQDWSLRHVRRLAELADYWVAFNAEFDRPFFEQAVEPESSKPWLCAYSEINWMPGWVDRPRSQIDLALSMGVGVLHAHRAGDDVRTLVACLDRQGDRLPTVIEDAIARISTPKVQVIANLPSSRQSPPDEKATYKAAGFWRNDRWEWVRDLRAYDFDRLWERWDFPVRVLSADDRTAREASPMVEVAAQVSYDDRQKASDLYFRWDSDRRAWVKEIRQWDYDQQLWSFPFPISRL